MKDMYEQIMKFGAYIVDALRQYKQPVIIYIPPNGELRGGAWAVVDPTINSRYMEMYADPESRGGVLEPEGTVEIKFKKKDLIKVMHRVDPEIKQLDEQVNAYNQQQPPIERKSSISQTVERKKPQAVIELEQKIAEREKYLLPVYHQVSVQFADLHDTPERMHEKGAISDIVPWRRSRTILYWRLRRLLLQDQIVSKLVEANPSYEDGGQAEATLRRWFIEDKGPSESYKWDNNQAVVQWLEEQEKKPADQSIINYNLHCVKKDSVLNKIKESLQVKHYIFFIFKCNSHFFL